MINQAENQLAILEAQEQLISQQKQQCQTQIEQCKQLLARWEAKIKNLDQPNS